MECIFPDNVLCAPLCGELQIVSFISAPSHSMNVGVAAPLTLTLGPVTAYDMDLQWCIATLGRFVRDLSKGHDELDAHICSWLLSRF